ncbi:MAG: transposase [Spirochaetia bacterium]|nr:transposase [Spirochaetia bacterium]
MLSQTLKHDLIKAREIKLIKFMQSRAEKELNKYKYHLSEDAKKRLRWLYILYYEQAGNISIAANKIGISRQWLSGIKKIFENSNRNPRSLEPKSRAPKNTSKRSSLEKYKEDLIIKIRKEYGWGKDKISAYLENEENIKVNHNTVNKYLHKHKLISPKLSLKNTMAIAKKKERETSLKAKFRPPSEIKDYKPGALIEKDMKYIINPNIKEQYKTKNSFRYQQTCTDSFTRIRTMEVTKNFDSQTVTLANNRSLKRFPFKVACYNTDNGSENNGYFADNLQDNDNFHFYSNVGTPTDNPRVERSHLTDEIEFYSRGNIYSNFSQQDEALSKWEYIYNYVRPHQALAYLTPMAFYELWKKNPEEAYQITEKWQSYLRKQSKRLAKARKIKKKEQIEALMNFIDSKLEGKSDINKSKLQLINCQLCSVA